MALRNAIANSRTATVGCGSMGGQATGANHRDNQGREVSTSNGRDESATDLHVDNKWPEGDEGCPGMPRRLHPGLCAPSDPRVKFARDFSPCIRVDVMQAFSSTI